MLVQSNLHVIDRSLRGMIGFSVILFALFNGNLIDDRFIEVLLGIFGALNLISLISGWCPVYRLAGISTKPNNDL